MRNILFIYILFSALGSQAQPDPMIGIQCEISEYKIILHTENQWVRTNLENGIYENYVLRNEKEECFELKFCLDEYYKTIWAHFSITLYDQEKMESGKREMHFYFYNYCWDFQKEYRFKIPPFKEGRFFYRIEHDDILTRNPFVPFEINENYMVGKYDWDILRSRKFTEQEISNRKEWGMKYKNWSLSFIKFWKEKQK